MVQSSNTGKDGGVGTKPKDIKLIQTCEMCPEQYDALDANGNIIGYLRVRWGYFAAYCPDDRSDDAVYSAEIQGHGAFLNNMERKRHLRKAKAAIAKWWNR